MNFFRSNASAHSKVRIVITGGPCSGKTALIKILGMNFHRELALVEDAAAFLFKAGFPRQTTVEGKKCQERAIYHLRQEFENLAELEQEKIGALCDHGSLDSLAYWPGDELEFFDSVKSSMSADKARYDWIINIDSLPPFELGASEILTETADEALKLNERVRHAWRLHPRLITLPNGLDFQKKADLVVKVVERILNAHQFGENLDHTHLVSNHC